MILIDVGSTFIKYAVLNSRTNDITDSEKIPFPGFLTNEQNRYTVSVESINNAIYRIMDYAHVKNCKQAFFAVQMHGYIIRNKDGSFSDYNSWADNSGDVTADIFSDVNFDCFGTSLKPNLPLTKLYSLNTDGELFTLGSYISYLLTEKNTTHITDACATGLYYAHDGTRNDFLQELTCPTVCKNVTAIGFYDDILIFTPVGDHQASFLGSRAENEHYLLNIGTATQISCLSDDVQTNIKCEKRPYFTSGKLFSISGMMGSNDLNCEENKNTLLCQIIHSIKILPKKSTLLLGGGGCLQVYSFLSEKLSQIGVSCALEQDNIGINGLKKLALQNKIKSGTMLSEICFPNFPIIAKNGGLDFFIIDNEHGCFDYSDIARLVMIARLVQIDVIVRVGESNRGHITKLADMGVHGFLLPMTNTKTDIQQLINHSMYPPLGKRGVSTTRAHTQYKPSALGDYMESANRNMKIFAQIETVAGIENIRHIIRTDGVYGVFIGPNDLSVDMNCISNKSAITDAIEKISMETKNAGKQFGIITTDKELIDASRMNGANLISYGSELNMLIEGCKHIKERF